jgi:hypothetical protein
VTRLNPGQKNVYWCKSEKAKAFGDLPFWKEVGGEIMKRRMSLSLLLAASLVLAAWGVPAVAETLKVPSAAFPTIQAAIDAANPGDKIMVKKGVYVEDLTILTDNIELRGGGCKSVIEGIETSPGPFPFAVPNIDIKANGVRITQFTIRSPDLSLLPDTYSSGMVLTGTNIEIDHNCFEAGTGDGSQAIQTWAGDNAPEGFRDISGLNIHHNYFTHREPATEFGTFDAYEAIFINGQSDPVDPANPVVIHHNEFSGELWRAIAVERSHTVISHNKISTDYSGPEAAISRAIELRPDFLAGSTSNHLVSYNKVENMGNGKGKAKGKGKGGRKGLSVFNWGIRAREDLSGAGYPPGPVLDYVIMNNDVKGAVTCIETLGNISSFTSNVVKKNRVADCGDGIYVGDLTTVEGNHVEDSANYGLRVANDNDVLKNHINNSGDVDLRIEGTGNTFDKNEFDTCSSSPDGLCP